MASTCLKILGFTASHIAAAYTVSRRDTTNATEVKSSRVNKRGVTYAARRHISSISESKNRHIALGRLSAKAQGGIRARVVDRHDGIARRLVTGPVCLGVSQLRFN